MNVVTEAACWANETFGGCELGDQRPQRVLAHARGHELLAGDQAGRQVKTVRLDIRPVADQRRAVPGEGAGQRPRRDCDRHHGAQQQHPSPGLEREKVLENAPQKEDGSFVVPKIIE